MSERHLNKFDNYRRLDLVEDESMAGETRAKKFEGEPQVFVSPAMFQLARTDFEKLAATLIVRELPARKQIRIR